MKDLVIIGSGPAGLSAAIYAQRAELDAVVLESAPSSGGQIINTDRIDNYPGFPGVNGYDLAMKMRDHADQAGASFVTDEVTGLETRPDGTHVVHGKKQGYETRAVIIASGANHRKLGVPGEKEFSGRGMSYCAVCDGAFYRGQTAAVAGGGDTAVGDAMFLARLCRKVYLIHRRDELRAAKSLQEALKKLPNVEILWNSRIIEVLGSRSGVTGVMLQDTKTGEKRQVDVSGVFAAVGMVPNADFAGPEIRRDPAGYIAAGEDCATNVPGIYAAGDVRSKHLRQIVTAVADGAAAVDSAVKYLAG